MKSEHTTWLFWGVLALQLAALSVQALGTKYKIGVGRADITGPAADVSLMGYGTFTADAGIHSRLYSRAFIIANADGTNRVVFVSTDTNSGSQLIQMQVIKQLSTLYPGLYTEVNVAISGTHTHSGPGGFYQYFVYNVPTAGFVRQSLDVIVQGVVKSIQLAHESMQNGYISMRTGELTGASINRSPLAYLQNPAAERALYDANVDQQMVLLKFTTATGVDIGMINWFAVHGTSINNTNHLISGDNKGYASMMFEKQMDPTSLMGQSKFVAAFAQTNLGDVSPNIMGPKCQDTGLPCDDHLSCNYGLSTQCYALGPGEDMYDSAEIIGQMQLDKALELFDSPNYIDISGSVEPMHQYINIDNVQVVLNETTTVKTCKASIGFAFAAGTTDGPGPGGFVQHTPLGTENVLWYIVRDALAIPPLDLIACQAPKPILIPTGILNLPTPWSLSVVGIQLLRIGNFLMAPVPAEFTTMSGRRFRDAVRAAFQNNPIDEIVIVGLANDYSQYVTTYEEYQWQNYEGGSTLYGPYTLLAYTQEYVRLAKALDQGQTVPAGPSPPDLLNIQIGTILPVINDNTFFSSFGSVVTDAAASYTRDSNGQATVSVTFVSGNPRNNCSLEGTFLTVEKKGSGNTWKVLYRDTDWNTSFMWALSPPILGVSQATCVWRIGPNDVPGYYRIGHFGYYKQLLSPVKPLSGYSKTFYVY